MEHRNQVAEKAVIMHSCTIIVSTLLPWQLIYKFGGVTAVCCCNFQEPSHTAHLYLAPLPSHTHPCTHAHPRTHRHTHTPWRRRWRLERVLRETEWIPVFEWSWKIAQTCSLSRIATQEERSTWWMNNTPHKYHPQSQVVSLREGRREPGNICKKGCRLLARHHSCHVICTFGWSWRANCSHDRPLTFHWD